jgi:hypothetical protein
METRAAALRTALLAPLLALAASGCATFGGDDEMVKAYHPTSVLVEWKRVAPKDCGTVQHAHGCSRITLNGNLCTIEVPENAPDWVLAHEFKHCFGYVHKRDARPQLAANASK